MTKLEFDSAVSSGSLCVESGPAVAFSSACGTTIGEPAAETKLQLKPNEAMVIGRQEGGELEYLDPRFAPTQIVPNTGQKVVKSYRDGPDIYVSRGHFM